MRIKADNTAERVEVNAGASDGELSADGALTAGDNVVVRGAERLAPVRKCASPNAPRSPPRLRLSAHAG